MTDRIVVPRLGLGRSEGIDEAVTTIRILSQPMESSLIANILGFYVAYLCREHQYPALLGSNVRSRISIE